MKFQQENTISTKKCNAYHAERYTVLWMGGSFKSYKVAKALAVVFGLSDKNIQIVHESFGNQCLGLVATQDS